MINADTSYSDMTAPDNRGIAVSEIEILNQDATHVTGVTHDGALIDYSVSLKSMMCGSGDQLVGDSEPATKAARRFVKARLKDGRFLMCHVKRHDVSYDILSEAEVQKVRTNCF